MNDWHVPDLAITYYLDGTVDDIESGSIEAHLTSCARCRASLAAKSDPAGFDDTWAAIVDELDMPRSTWLERILASLGVSPTTARLVAATPRLRTTWVLAVMSAIALSVLSSRAVEDANLFLFLAPLVPLLAITAAFGPTVEPTFEITIAAPFDKGRLLALRAIIVLTSAIVILIAGVLVIPALGSTDVLWLLPALALASVGLCLTTWMPGTRAALITGISWPFVVAFTTEHQRLSDLANHCSVFTPGGQLIAAGVVIAAAAVTIRRRSSFDLPRFA